MNRLSVAVISLSLAALVASPAIAADMPMPYKASPVPTPVFTWTGFYVGGNVGGGFGDKWWDNNNSADNSFWFGYPGQSIGTTSMEGFLGGAQVGFNWQIPSLPVVIGVEGTWDWSDINGHFASGVPGELTMTNTSKLSSIATVVGRVGLAVDHALLYAGGGAAWTREQDSVTSFGPGLNGFLPQQISYNGSTTENGWTVLAGVEYAVGNWSARLQYNYYEFGSGSLIMPAGNAGTIAYTGAALGISTPLRVNSVTAALNYRINWWGY